MQFRLGFAFLFTFSLLEFTRAEFLLSSEGKPACVIAQQSGATSVEQHAVWELKLHLDLMTGGNFQIITNAPWAREKIKDAPLNR